MIPLNTMGISLYGYKFRMVLTMLINYIRTNLRHEERTGFSDDEACFAAYLICPQEHCRCIVIAGDEKEASA